MSDDIQTDSKPVPSGNDFARLNTLHRQIRDSHKNVKDFSERLRRNLQSAMLESIIAGDALAEIKRIVGRSRFERVVNDHQKGISEAEIRAYMKLHGNPNMEFKKAASLLGIFGNAPEPGPSSDPSKMEDRGAT